MSTIVHDAEESKVIRARLELLRDALANHPMTAPILERAAPVAALIDPIVTTVDNRVSNAINHVASASKPRPVHPDTRLPTISSGKLLDDARKGKFLKQRLHDIASVGSVASDQIELNAGGLGRLAFHTTTSIASWWAIPMLYAYSKIGEPILNKLDDGIGSVCQNAQRHDGNNQLTVNGLINATFDSVKQAMTQSPAPTDVAKHFFNDMRELLKVDVVAYAENVILRAREVAQHAKHSEQLNKALETANSHLNSIKSKLSPHAAVLLERLHEIADIGRQARFKTRSYTETFWQNFQNAYGKTRELTDSTIVYLDTHDMRLIPADVYEFCRKSMGMTEPDEAYDELMKQFKDLFDSLTHVFMLSHDKHSEGEVTGPIAPSTAA